MGFFDTLKRGLERSREALNEVFYFGGEVDEDFWEDLEDRLVMGDMGGEVAMRVTDDLRDLAARKNLTRADQLKGALAERLAAEFCSAERDPFEDTPSCALFVGINGAGKTTTVGKLAGRAVSEGKKVVIGGADTFRAAAIEQLQVWGERAGVDVITRERGCDPASVCYDVVDEAERRGCDLTLPHLAKRADAFYLGGTKNGMLFGEAMVIANPRLRESFPFLIKERGGLMAKGRLLGVQFETAFAQPDDGSEALYWRLARSANDCALRLREGLNELGFTSYLPANSNQQFFVVTPEVGKKFEDAAGCETFAQLPDGRLVIRFVTSWATRPEHVDELLEFAATVA